MTPTLRSLPIKRVMMALVLLWRPEGLFKR